MSIPTIVLIDDHLPSLIALEQIIDDLDVVCEKFTNAPEALSYMLKSPPSCVLVDVDLPEMDGIEFTRLVKEDPTLKHTPIMLITGKVYTTNEEASAITSGACDYIKKPVNGELLRQKIRTLIKLNKCMGQLKNLTQSMVDVGFLEDETKLDRKSLSFLKKNLLQAMQHLNE